MTPEATGAVEGSRPRPNGVGVISLGGGTVVAGVRRVGVPTDSGIARPLT